MKKPYLEVHKRYSVKTQWVTRALCPDSLKRRKHRSTIPEHYTLMRKLKHNAFLRSKMHKDRHIFSESKVELSHIERKLVWLMMKKMKKTVSCAKAKINLEKGRTCYYCGKLVHISLDCKVRANDVLIGRVRKVESCYMVWNSEEEELNSEEGDYIQPTMKKCHLF